MNILHVVPGLAQGWNGISVAARILAKFQRADLCETKDFVRGSVPFMVYDEIWVHSNWWPPTLMACLKVIRAKKPLVRMTHANLDPIRYRSKHWKKMLVSPIERYLYRHTSRVVVTCEEEKDWCIDWGVKAQFQILDLKQYFNLSRPVVAIPRDRELRILFLGRNDPLKGVKYLETAVDELNNEVQSISSEVSRERHIELQIVSSKFGEELERIWGWCDVLVLPTLTENFGLVVAEAIERGKYVVITDGAPAWSDIRSEHGVYIKGYRDASDTTRVHLLKSALMRVLDNRV